MRYVGSAIILVVCNCLVGCMYCSGILKMFEYLGPACLWYVDPMCSPYILSGTCVIHSNDSVPISCPCRRCIVPPVFECTSIVAVAPPCSPLSPYPNPGSKNPSSWNCCSSNCNLCDSSTAERCGGILMNSLDERRCNFSVGFMR